MDSALAEVAAAANAWPFEEARKLVERLKRTGKKEALFETGYGPSGLPHIGTFGEVARTSMVRHAFRVLTGDAIPTRLVAFSDDMDGLRKVPDNVPNREMMAQHLNLPLTEVPDPFGTHDSFGAHNNARLRAFLDAFGFDYEFLSSTECYRSGRFDATLLTVLERYDAVMAIMLPSLREERQQTYSPFLPIHPRTRHVMQVPIDEVRRDAGTIVWRDPATGERFETPVTGGGAKLQWKPDWAMRWVALGVDYEMAGKDLIDSVKLSGEIARALGGQPPEGFNYELFLDERGGKISKSKGNGLTIDEWLAYGTPESLSLFMYNKPREAKRLLFRRDPAPRRRLSDLPGEIPGAGRQGAARQPGLAHPCRRAARARARRVRGRSARGDDLLRDAPQPGRGGEFRGAGRAVGLHPPLRAGRLAETHPRLDRLVGHAVRYFHDFVRTAKVYRLPSEAERRALSDLSEALRPLEGSTDAEALQAVVYEVGRTHFPDTSGKSKSPDGRPGVAQTWFATLYGVLLGQERGPRFGSFVALYGVAETRVLIAKALAGDLLREHEAFLTARGAARELEAV